MKKHKYTTQLRALLVLSLALVSCDGLSDGNPSAPNASGSTSSNGQASNSTGSSSFSKTTYIKASNPDENDNFGSGAALNEDGKILVVGAPAERSANGQEDDNSRANGAVYIFSKEASGWSQQAYLKPRNLPQAGQSPSKRLEFGNTVAINDKGTTIAVTAPGELQASNEEGGVYIFDFVDGSWVEQDLLKITHADQFAQSRNKNNAGIGLDGAGNTLVVAEFGDDSPANQINGDETAGGAPVAGAAHVFMRSNNEWKRETFLKGSAVKEGDGFGSAVAISGDGKTIAVASAGGITSSGSVYVFTRTGDSWSEQQHIQPTEDTKNFGSSLSLSHSGDILAIGSHSDNGGGTGVGSDPKEGFVISSGAVHIFERAGNNWAQQEYLKASATDINDQFGRSVSLSSAGDKLVVGALGESSDAKGINGDPSNNNASLAGAAYVFSRSSGTWKQDAYLKSGHPVSMRNFGSVVGISGNGTTVVVDNIRDASKDTGINGDESNESLPFSGAVNVFE